MRKPSRSASSASYFYRAPNSLRSSGCRRKHSSTPTVEYMAHSSSSDVPETHELNTTFLLPGRISSATTGLGNLPVSMIFRSCSSDFALVIGTTTKKSLYPNSRGMVGGILLGCATFVISRTRCLPTSSHSPSLWSCATLGGPAATLSQTATTSTLKSPIATSTPVILKRYTTRPALSYSKRAVFATE